MLSLKLRRYRHHYFKEFAGEVDAYPSTSSGQKIKANITKKSGYPHQSKAKINNTLNTIRGILNSHYSRVILVLVERTVQQDSTNRYKTTVRVLFKKDNYLRLYKRFLRFGGILLLFGRLFLLFGNSM